MKLNRQPTKTITYEGGKAVKIPLLRELKRAVCACLLWENTFYESGEDIADRIARLTLQVGKKDAVALANEARSRLNLRHVPLWVMCALAKNGKMKANELVDVIQRPDEITEFVAMYLRGSSDRKTVGESFTRQVKKGLGEAFRKFDEYQLRKYKQEDKAIKLRDVMKIARPKPKNDEQAALWGRLVQGKLKVAETWEKKLSEVEGTAEQKKQQKKASFEELMDKQKLGAMATIRNLRNMTEQGVDITKIRTYLKQLNVRRILPYRFLTAAKYAPQFEPELEHLMFKASEEIPKLKGETIILVDVSGSMRGCPLSNRSEVIRHEAAAAIAILAREVCEHSRVIAFATLYTEVPPRRGFALRDALFKATGELGGSTNGGAAIRYAQSLPHSRIICITDEQFHDSCPGVKRPGYMMNIAPYQFAVSQENDWTCINGFSSAVLDFVREVESWT